MRIHPQHSRIRDALAPKLDASLRPHDLAALTRSSFRRGASASRLAVMRPYSGPWRAIAHYPSSANADALEKRAATSTGVSRGAGGGGAGGGGAGEEARVEAR